MKLTQEYLKECLHYDPETGIFTWLVRPVSHFKDGKIQKSEHICSRWNTIFSKTIAGCKNNNGYISICIDYKEILAHRLAWLYEYGYMPENMIDHIDRVRTNNFIINLREVGDSCSMQNTGMLKNNTSGVKGVSWHKISNKWSAQIKIHGKKKHLGLFTNFDDAVKARWEEENDNPNWTCQTSSSAYSYLKEKNLIGEKYEDFST